MIKCSKFLLFTAINHKLCVFLEVIWFVKRLQIFVIFVIYGFIYQHKTWFNVVPSGFVNNVCHLVIAYISSYTGQKSVGDTCFVKDVAGDWEHHDRDYTLVEFYLLLIYTDDYFVKVCH